MNKLSTIVPVALLAALAGCAGPSASNASENLGEADQAITEAGSWVDMPVPSTAGDVHCAYTSGSNKYWMYLKLQQIGSSSVEVYGVHVYVWSGSSTVYYTATQPQYTLSAGDTFNFTDSSDSYFQLVAGTDAHGNMTLALQNGYFSYDGTMVECDAYVVSPTASASGVGILGEPWIGSTLTGYYSFSDTEGLSESGSTFQWYRVYSGDARAALNGATSENYTVTSADLGEDLEFCVTPADSYGSGAQVCSSATTMSAAYSATASNVTISGNPWVGATLTGSVSLSDGDHLSESAAYQWYTVSGGTATPISGATSATYVPTSSEIDGELELCVTPSDSFGAGEQVCSSPVTVAGVVWYSGASQSGTGTGETTANGTCVNVSSLDLGFTPMSLALDGQASAQTTIDMYKGSNCSGIVYTRTASAGGVHNINLDTVGIGSNLVSYKITW